MTTKDVIQSYFSSLQQKRGWEEFLTEDLVFTSFVSPNKQVRGRAAYLESTKRFFAMIASVEVRELLTDAWRIQAPRRLVADFDEDLRERGAPRSTADPRDTPPPPGARRRRRGG